MTKINASLDNIAKLENLPIYLFWMVMAIERSPLNSVLGVDTVGLEGVTLALLSRDIPCMSAPPLVG